MTNDKSQPSWLSYSSYAFTFFVRAAIIALVLVLAVVVIRGLNQEGYRVRPFQMPKHLNDAGYTGSISAIMLQNKVQELKAIATSIKSDSTTFNVDTRPDLNLDLMGVGLSTGSIIFHMRELMGRDNEVIDGSITLLDDILTLHLWMTGQSEFSYEAKVENGQVKAAIEDAVTKGAMHVLGKTDPYRLAILYYRNKDMAKAEDVIRLIIKEMPQDRKWAYNLWGNIKSELDQQEQAIKYYRRAIEIDPTFELPRRLLGWRLVAKKNFEEALVHFEKAVDLESGYLPAYNGAAMCHRQQGNFDEAEKYYKLAMEKFPQVIWTYGNYSNFLMTQRNDTLGAANVWKQAGEHMGQNADYYISTATFYIMSGDTAKALEYGESALELDPYNPTTLNGFANFYDETGEYELSEELSRRLLKVYHQGQYDRGMMMSAYNSLSIVEYKQNKFDSSYAHVMKAISYVPDNPFPHTTLAELNLLRGNRRGFYSAIDKAIELGLEYQDWLEEWPYDRMMQDQRYLAMLDKLKNIETLKG